MSVYLQSKSVIFSFVSLVSFTSIDSSFSTPPPSPLSYSNMWPMCSAFKIFIVLLNHSVVYFWCPMFFQEFKKHFVSSGVSSFSLIHISSSSVSALRDFLKDRTHSTHIELIPPVCWSFTLKHSKVPLMWTS